MVDLSDVRLHQLSYLVLSSCGIVGNVLILAVLAKKKKMREKEFHLPYLLAFSEMWLCVATFFAGSHRMYYFLTDQWGPIFHKRDCLVRPHVLLFTMGFMMNPMANFAICIDRLIAITKPFYYYGLTTRYTKRISFLVIGSTFGYSIPLFVASIYQNWSDEKLIHVSCIPPHAMLPGPFMVVHYIDGALSFASLVLIGVMLVLFLTRERSKLEDKADSVQAIAQKRNDRVTKMLMYSLVISAFLSCIPSIAMTIILEYRIALQWLQFFNMLNVANCINNVGLYVWKNADMREAIRELLGLQKGVAGGSRVTVSVNVAALNE